MKQEREHWIALFPVQYSLNILFGRHFFSRLVIMGNPSAANETLEPFKDRQFIHGLHQPLSDAEFSIVRGHGNIDDIKGVSIVLMCADIPVVCHFVPAVVRMMRIKISHERRHRTDDSAFGNRAKCTIGKSFNMGMELLFIPQKVFRKRRRKAFSLECNQIGNIFVVVIADVHLLIRNAVIDVKLFIDRPSLLLIFPSLYRYFSRLS